MTEVSRDAKPPTNGDLQGESAGLDLTPRAVDDKRRSGRRWVPTAIVVAVLAAMGFVLFQTLGDTALFFYNADEAIDRRTELVDQRFRLQGTPFGDPVSVEITSDSGSAQVAVVFPVRFNEAVVDVVHVGAPAQLFQPGVPVVLEGQWKPAPVQGVDAVTQGANDGWHFASSDMVVKHDNDYRNDNSSRIDDAERGGFTPES